MVFIGRISSTRTDRKWPVWRSLGESIAFRFSKGAGEAPKGFSAEGWACSGSQNSCTYRLNWLYTLVHMPCERRVVFYLESEDFSRLKEAAGIVPISAWARSVLLDRLNDAVPGLRFEARPGPLDDKRVTAAHQISPDSIASEVDKRESDVPRKCHHHKEKGSLCFKCDSRWGFPVIP
jgi:hypothetical protein